MFHGVEDREHRRGVCPFAIDVELDIPLGVRGPTSFGMIRIRSRIASMLGTEPPGEWIHSAMSALASSAASPATAP